MHETNGEKHSEGSFKITREMKNITCFCVLILFLGIYSCSVHEYKGDRPKYVFFLIGDGMGSSQVTGTQFYLAERAGRIGLDSLSFTGFPVTNVVSTYSAFNAITCSAAAGTALATGMRTSNGTIGKDAIHSKDVYSIAVKAKERGMGVGIATSVSIDHATPASFYAHQPSRSMYYEIAMDAIKADFDLYAGSGFLQTRSLTDSAAPEVYCCFEEAGYTVVRGYDDFNRKREGASKMVFVQEAGANPFSLSYAIDRQPGDLTLSEITRGAIDYLFQKSNRGFFLMVEGGKIDWACHSNDGATMVKEVMDFSDAVEVVLEFYRQHPKETLIIVTADHETGGVGLGTRGYELNLKLLSLQQHSLDILSNRLINLRENREGKVTWEEVKEVFSEELGFWSKIEIMKEEEEALKQEFERSYLQASPAVWGMYAVVEPLAQQAVRLLNDKAQMGWTTLEHTGTRVPMYAIGVGAWRFAGSPLNNTDIPRIIVEATGWN